MPRRPRCYGNFHGATAEEEARCAHARSLARERQEIVQETAARARVLVYSIARGLRRRGVRAGPAAGLDRGRRNIRHGCIIKARCMGRLTSARAVIGIVKPRAAVLPSPRLYINMCTTWAEAARRSRAGTRITFRILAPQLLFRRFAASSAFIAPI